MELEFRVVHALRISTKFLCPIDCLSFMKVVSLQPSISSRRSRVVDIKERQIAKLGGSLATVRDHHFN